MPPLTDNPNDQARHEAAIASLAAQTGVEVEEVSRVYESVLTRLASGARLRQFVPLLVARYTRERLRAEHAHR